MTVNKQFLRSLQELLDDDKTTVYLCNDLAIERLVDYLDADLSGAAPEEFDPAVKAHLASCAMCREEYSELKQLFQLEQGQSPVDLPGAARFDFSYLAGEPTAGGGLEGAPGGGTSDGVEQSWRLDELGRLIIRFSAGLLQTLRTQTQQPDYALVRSQAPTEVGYHYALRQTVEDCDVTITVHETTQDNTERDMAQSTEMCTIVVSVDIPSRGGWPNLAGTTVVLKRGDTLLYLQQTDAFGKTAFRSVAAEDLPQLVFEIG
jgi:hypothetical protein